MKLKIVTPSSFYFILVREKRFYLRKDIVVNCELVWQDFSTGSRSRLDPFSARWSKKWLHLAPSHARGPYYGQTIGSSWRMSMATWECVDVEICHAARASPSLKRALWSFHSFLPTTRSRLAKHVTKTALALPIVLFVERKKLPNGTKRVANRTLS